MDSHNPLLQLLLHLSILSLAAIGGINVILPDLHRVVVVGEGWLTEEEFTTLFALAQAAPGPNMLVITLIGWRIGGIIGGIAATLAICGPAVIFAYFVGRIWMAWGERPWFKLLQRGLVPISIGLIMASAWLLTNAAAHGPSSYLVTMAAAAVVLFTRVHPIFVLAGAGALGIAGLA